MLYQSKFLMLTPLVLISEYQVVRNIIMISVILRFFLCFSLPYPTFHISQKQKQGSSLRAISNVNYMCFKLFC